MPRTATTSNSTPSPTPGATAPKTERVSQSTFPFFKLSQALLISQKIVDEFGGKAGNPNQIAIAMKWTPTSSAWRMLTGSSIAYGLTDGGYGASEIRLTARGSAIVSPTEENGEKPHLLAAILEPTVMRAFVEKYRDAKFPSKEIGINVLQTFGLPRNRCADAYDIIEDNLQYVGALVPTNTGKMVLLGAIGSQPVAVVKAFPFESAQPVSDFVPPTPPLKYENSDPIPPPPPAAPQNMNVFISHGKSRDLVETLKRAVTYGKFTPIVSVEQSDTSKPVPQKIMEEMRSCFGGIVHVRSEGEWTDADGNKKEKINDNVLIEIGAAMAMYRDNFILLVERTIKLPSNLQGLFVCYYEGDKLDGEATMRLLEGLNKFKP